MESEQWRRIEDLYHRARTWEPGVRAARLAEACLNDPTLQREVEELLAQQDRSGLLDRTVGGGASAASDDAPTVELPPGTDVGPYRITGILGAGGMGHVYLAYDSRLGRSVAIKFVRARFIERCEREARAIAALNHPSICTLYDIGPHYLVMEFVDGETLSARIRRGKLSTADVLRYGRQIADALAEAHAHGVVHRDLKPANVMLTRSGVKVLDFGLARLTNVPVEPLTQTYGAMGTPEYMAPEQLNGEAGPPADVFALGRVLSEMTGRVSDGSKATRDLKALTAQLLTLAPGSRPSAVDVRDRLDALARRLTSPQTRARKLLVAGVAAAAVCALTGMWWSVTHRAASARQLVPARISKLTFFPGDETEPALSPDGHSVAFCWNGGIGTTPAIYVMRVGDNAPRRLTNDPVNDISPTWSPDGTQVAFLRLTSISTGHLMVVPAGGGPARIVRDVRLIDTMYRAIRPLLTWAPDGTGIVYTTQDDDAQRASLYVTDPQGKSAHKLFTPTEGAAGSAAPALSADGKWLAYAEVYGPYAARLYVRPFSPGPSTTGEATLVSGPTVGLATTPVWAPGNRTLFYMQGSAIFEWNRDEGPRQVYVAAGLAGMSIAWGPDRGMLVAAAEADQAELRLISLHPGGLSAAGGDALFLPYTSQSAPMFAPDGKSVLFHGPRSGADEVWVADSNGQNPRQLTHLNPATLGFPTWAPDGKRIAFHARIGALPQIFTLEIAQVLGQQDGPSVEVAPKRITDSAFGFYSPVWSADGKYIYANRANGGGRIFRIPAEGGAPEDLFEGVSPRVTPDGHTILYGKDGHLGMFSRSLDGDVAANPEVRLVEDYRPPAMDLNPFSDGVYYIGWDGAGKPRIVRFYSYARKKSADVAVLPGRIPDVPGMSVSPDRRRLLYSQFTMTGKDLMLVEFR